MPPRNRTTGKPGPGGPEQDKPDTSAAREREGNDEPAEVSLAGATIRVPGSEHWTASATDHLSSGRVQEWAAATLDDESWDTWLELDPTNAQIADMFEDLDEKLGVSVGESRASRRLRQRMARR